MDFEPGLRTVDVARRVGCSVQHVRDLERGGVLPPADRTGAGYRVHTEVHVRSVLAYRALAAGVGPVEAKRIMRAVHAGPVADVLAMLDAAHARLDRERRDLALAKAAAEAISTEAIDEVRPSDALTVSELAGALGVRPSTLRHWDAEGLVVPDRVGTARRYSPTQVRDARIVHELRTAGYRIEPLRALLPNLRELRGALATRDADIAARSRALFDAAVALSAILGAQP